MEETARNVEFEDIDDASDVMEATPLFWSQKIEKSGELVPINPPSNEQYIIHITHASFGATVTKGSRTVVMITNDTDEEVPICVLTQGRNENEQLDLLINQPCQLAIRGTKPCTVFLTGYSQPEVDGQDDHDLEDANDLSPEQIRELMKNGMVDEDNADEVDEVDDDADADQDIGDKDDGEDADDTSAQEPPQKKQKLEKGAKVTKQIKNDNNNKSSKVTTQKKNTTEIEENKTTEESSTTATTTATTANSDKTEAKKNKKKGKRMQNMKGGIQFRDMKQGNGDAIKVGKKVTVHYVGQFGDTKPMKVFDKVISHPGFTFTFGKGDVIKGWEMGLKGAKVGTKRKLVIPSKLAYGSDGTDGIPANTDLTFTIEVLSVQ